MEWYLVLVLELAAYLLIGLTYHIWYLFILGFLMGIRLVTHGIFPSNSVIYELAERYNDGFKQPEMHIIDRGMSRILLWPVLMYKIGCICLNETNDFIKRH